MDDLTMCSKDRKPKMIYCPKCELFMCYNCLIDHSQSNCSHPISIISYVEKEILSKYDEQFVEYNGRKTEIEGAVKDFVDDSRKMKMNLIALKEKFETTLKIINRVINLTASNCDMAISIHDAINNHLNKEREEIKSAILEEDMDYLISRILRKEIIRILDLGDAQKERIARVEGLASELLQASEIAEIEEDLKLLEPSYITFSNQCGHSRVTGKFVYGNCSPLGFDTLCRFNVETRRLTTCAVIPTRATITQIGERVFYSGGSNPVNAQVREYVDRTKKIIEKTKMSHAKYYHTAQPVSYDSFVVVGGFDGYSSMNVCEEYIVKNNQWAHIPPLKSFRYSAATVFINDQYLYVIGGTGVKEVIERLDMSTRKEWSVVPIKCEESKTVQYTGQNPAAFPISNTEIIIFCGGNSSAAALFDTKDNTVTSFSSSLKCESYYSNPVCTLGGCAYTIGGDYGHVQIYMVGERRLKTIDFADATSVPKN